MTIQTLLTALKYHWSCYFASCSKTWTSTNYLVIGWEWFGNISSTFSTLDLHFHSLVTLVQTRFHSLPQMARQDDSITYACVLSISFPQFPKQVSCCTYLYSVIYYYHLIHLPIFVPSKALEQRCPENLNTQQQILLGEVRISTKHFPMH